MVVVSLRVTMGVLNAAVVAAVAAVTLGITLSVSFNAVRSIGTRHSDALADSAHTQLDSFLQFPAVTVDVIRNMTFLEQWPYPSTDTNYTLIRWQDIVRNSYFSDELQAAGVHVMMLDGTYIYAVPSVVRNLFRLHAQYPAGLATVTNDTLYATQDLTELSTLTYADEITTVTDLRTSGTLKALATLTNGSTTPAWDPNFSTVLQADGSVRYTRAVTSPLFTADGNLYGFASVNIFFDSVSTILKSVRGTANTFAFAMDGNGYVIGSSNGAPFSYTTTAAIASSKKGCFITSTTAVIGIASPQVATCLVHMTEYGYSPLRAVAARSDLFSLMVRTTVFLSIDSDNYFTVVDPIEVRYNPLKVTVVLLMPENDVVGDIVAGRDLTIGVTSAVFVIVAALSVLLIWLLLRPLGEISRRMLKAASLQDDEEASSLSVVSEIRSLQEAYHSMNAELRRIRSFVPQSLLQSNQRNSPSDDTFDSLIPPIHNANGIPGGTSGGGGSAGASAPLFELNLYSSQQGSSDPDRRSSQATETDSWHNSSIDEDPDTAMFGHIPISDVRPEADDDHPTASLRSVRIKLAQNMLPPVAALHSAIGVRGEVVSVLAANLSGFHAACKTLTHDDIALRIRTTVDSVFRAVSEHRGVLERFNGDHFFASFNASRPCPNHPVRAVAAACSLLTGKTYGGFGLKWRLGVATSKAYVGNLGSDDIKGYNVIGSAVTHALTLERLGKLYRKSTVMVPHRMFSDLKDRFLIRAVDVVSLPGLTRPTVVGEAIPFQANTGDVNAKGDASFGSSMWVYEKTPAAMNLVTRNRFFELIARKEAEAATTMLRALEQEAHQHRLKSDDDPSLALQRFEVEHMIETCDVPNMAAAVVQYAAGAKDPSLAGDLSSATTNPERATAVMGQIMDSAALDASVPANTALVDTPTMVAAVQALVPRFLTMSSLLRELKEGLLEQVITDEGRRPSVMGTFYDCAIVLPSSAVDDAAEAAIAELERQGKLPPRV